MDQLEKEYEIFDLFKNKWALVSAGDINNFNSCTVSWGSMGTLWSKPVITVYIHPSRYTCDFLKKEDYFSVSFYDEEYRKSLSIMGTISGRDTNKVLKANLTPIELNKTISFNEANTTFVCKKLYQHSFSKDDLNKEIEDYYISKPKSFPLDENNNYNPHIVFVGEVVEVVKNNE